MTENLINLNGTSGKYEISIITSVLYVISMIYLLIRNARAFLVKQLRRWKILTLFLLRALHLNDATMLATMSSRIFDNFTQTYLYLSILVKYLIGYTRACVK